jgi:hypothetical protein
MNANNNNNNNNNNVDDIVVVHRIPAMDPSCGGHLPMVQLMIMAGQYDDTNSFFIDIVFAEDRWREAVEANAERRGVAVIRPDE